VTDHLAIPAIEIEAHHEWKNKYNDYGMINVGRLYGY
jgi:hypothetical protein